MYSFTYVYDKLFEAALRLFDQILIPGTSITVHVPIVYRLRVIHSLHEIGPCSADGLVR